MSVRAIVSIASILGLLVTAAAAQQAGTAATASASSALTNPPVFQGLMVDAKGKTVGRFFPNLFFGFPPCVVRQIDGVWVWLSVTDLTIGFDVVQPPAGFYYYQSVDCVGQAYLPVNQ